MTIISILVPKKSEIAGISSKTASPTLTHHPFIPKKHKESCFRVYFAFWPIESNVLFLQKPPRLSLWWLEQNHNLFWGPLGGLP